MKNKSIQPRILSREDVITLVKSVKIPLRSIENQIGIPIGLLGRAIKGNQAIPLPFKWEQPLIEFVKKINAEKKDVAIERNKVLSKITGNPLPEVVPENLSEEDLASKKEWHKKVHDAVAPFVVSRFLTGE